MNVTSTVSTAGSNVDLLIMLVMGVVPHTECLTLYNTIYTLYVLCYTHQQH